MPNLLERLGQMFGGGRKEEAPVEQPMPSESAASSTVGTQPEPVSTVEETTMGTAGAPQTAAPEPMAGTTPVDTSADVLAADTMADQSASAPAMATEPPVATPEETPAEAPAAPAAESAAAPAMESTPAPAMETAAAERTYTVEEGDTLSAIAERFYGSANDWPRIHEANRDQFENPDMIYPGQTLKIP